MDLNKKYKKFIKILKLIQIIKRKYKKRIWKTKTKIKTSKALSKKNKLILFLISFIIIIISTKFVLKRKAFDEFKSHKVFIEAHQGFNPEIFQNSKKSIILAMKYGLDSFETDVWLSKDKVLVLVHAGYMGNISLLYNANYNIINTNWNELSTVRTRKGSFPFPRLDEVMKLTKNKIFMNLEVKDPRCDLVFPEIIKLIVKYNYFEQISISSFNHKYYTKILEFNKNNKYGKKLVFGFLYGGGFNTKQYEYHKKYNSLNLFWTKITKEICQKAHSNGMAVFAWISFGTKETYSIYKRLFDCGIDILCSNEPLKAKKFRYLYYRNIKYRTKL